MTAQFIKNRAFMEKLKEGDIPKINFDLAGSAQDYNLESLEEETEVPSLGFVAAIFSIFAIAIFRRN